MAEFVEHYLRDPRLQSAYLGQGVIGTNASPFDPGTASIRFHHASGRLGGMPGMWGYVAAAWAWSPSTSPTPRRKPEPSSHQAYPSQRSCPAKASCSNPASASPRLS